MSYPEEDIAMANESQASSLGDIAESLRIISGRTSLKENRLREEIENLYNEMHYSMEESDETYEKIRKMEEEIYQDRLNREKGWNK